MSATADLAETFRLFKAAQEMGGHPDPYPLLAELVLVIRAQDARIAELETRMSDHAAAIIAGGGSVRI